MNRPQAVIFDLGGVLVDVNKKVSIRKWNLLTGGDTTSFEQIFFSDRLKNRFNEGSIDSSSFLHTIKTGIGSPPPSSLSSEPIPESSLKSIWTAMLRPRSYTEKIIDLLHGSLHLAILSDTDPIHASYMENEFGFFQKFKVKTYSYLVGATKPDKRMYSAVLNELGIEANSCVFFDDRPQNVTGAINMGIRAYKASNEKDILGGLKKEGLPTYDWSAETHDSKEHRNT